jgi:pimeloyl-ACP methyl ester carboxylesterase
MQGYLDIKDNLESRLAELAMPTLVTHGDEDSRIPVEYGRQLHRAIAGSELFIVPGAEHGLMGNEPPLMRKVILEFLARRASPAGSAAR